MQCSFDFARIDRRSLHLEHVVAPAGEEQIPVGVDETDVAGWIETVGGEEVLARASADPAHEVPASQLDLTGPTLRKFLAVVHVDNANLDVSKRPSTTPALVRWEIPIESIPAVRPERLGHSQQIRALSGCTTCRRWKHGREAERLQGREVGAREVRMGGDARRLGPANRGTTSPARVRGGEASMPVRVVVP